MELDKLSNGNLSLKQKEIQAKKIDALYRLGTYEDMKDVWFKLLDKDAKAIKCSVEKELALVSGIYECIWREAFGEKKSTPKDKNMQLGEVTKAIKELQRVIKKSNEAAYETHLIVETLLHKKNLEYRNQRGENKSFPKNPNWLKFNEGSATQELSILAFDEHMSWLDRFPAQRLGWWTREAMALNLTEILDYYSEIMDYYSKVYDANYAMESSKIREGLSWLMNQIYGKDFNDYVARIMNAILADDSWDKDRVRKNGAYKKAK
jgi:NurA-like 5'-3' nuclease